MKIGYISDLHCEGYSKLPLMPEADVICLAGDIHTKPSGIQKVVSNIRKQTEAIILYVMGNHEYYNNLFPNALNDYRVAVAKTKNAFLLEKDIHVVDDIRFLGTTVLTCISKSTNTSQVYSLPAMNCWTIQFGTLLPKNASSPRFLTLAFPLLA